MINCEHKNIAKRIETRQVFGENFKWQADVCKECSAVLWDNEVQLKYDSWLADVYKTNRDKFSVQSTLPAGASECLIAIARRFPSVDESSLMHALISVY